MYGAFRLATRAKAMKPALAPMGDKDFADDAARGVSGAEEQHIVGFLDCHEAAPAFGPQLQALPVSVAGTAVCSASPSPPIPCP